MSKRTTKLLAGAAMLGLCSAANASLVIDVRDASTNSKAISASPGSTVTVNVYLQSSNPAGDLPNGLGGFGVAVLSQGETAGGNPWPGNRTTTSTVLNASGGTNVQPTNVFEVGYSAGANSDVTAVSGNPDLNDTDLDRTGLSGTQDSSGGWSVNYAQAAETLLGTATFTILGDGSAAQPYPQTVNLNAIFTGASGAAGGSLIRGLNNQDTGATNGITANLLTGAGNIGAPVVVTVNSVPEPASLGLLGIAGFGLFRRRRTA